MRHRLMKFGKFSAFALAAIAIAGCATRGDLDKLRAEVNEARQLADQAQQAASEARTTAARAEQRADEGVNCCNEVKESMDRMFQRSMRK